MMDVLTFDLDGTLVDTADEIAEAANRALADHGIGRRGAAEVRQLIGAGGQTLMIRLLARVFHERPALADTVRVDAVLARWDHHYERVAGTRATPYTGAHEALARLAQAGVRLACVTNKEQRHARRVLEATGLDRRLPLLIGGDTLAEKKPHPSVLRHAVQALGGRIGHSAHVGDSAIDVEAARNAGVEAWAVPYGYNGGVPIEDSRPARLFPDLLAVAGACVP
jgi:phosphoglycolate phosphatase